MLFSSTPRECRSWPVFRLSLDSKIARSKREENDACGDDAEVERTPQRIELRRGGEPAPRIAHHLRRTEGGGDETAAEAGDPGQHDDPAQLLLTPVVERRKLQHADGNEADEERPEACPLQRDL